MDLEPELDRTIDAMAVPSMGRLAATGDRRDPYRLFDAAGQPVVPVTSFFRELQAVGRSEATMRSYGMDLLRWFRFLWVIDVAWDRATRIEARDFCRWMLVAGKSGSDSSSYSTATRAHSETVLRSFYAFHLDTGSGPILNPFPLDRSRNGGRAHAHHNPMEPFRNERSGLYRPRVPVRIPRSVPDEEFNDIFARLSSHRDRALVAFYVSTGARASELLSVAQGGVDPGRGLISVVRKATAGSRSCRRPRTPSSGCGCISWNPNATSRPGGGCRCGGRFDIRSAR
jgi:integrase